jgi:hypothetical protein
MGTGYGAYNGKNLVKCLIFGEKSFYKNRLTAARKANYSKKAVLNRYMKTLLLILVLLFIYQAAFAEDLIKDADDASAKNPEENKRYYDYENTEGITIYAEHPQPEFPPESTEANILAMLNGFQEERERFIKEDLLKNAGFRGTANVKFRKTNDSEKALSVLHGMMHIFSLNSVPTKPFSEIEYARLPRGEFYKFESVIYASQFKDISPLALRVIELEYILQVEFGGGILIQSHNLKCYTEENIAKFTGLAMSLPDYPPSIKQVKDRYLDIELPKIRASLDRFKNPSENALRARENLSGSFWLGE